VVGSTVIPHLEFRFKHLDGIHANSIHT